VAQYAFSTGGTRASQSLREAVEQFQGGGGLKVGFLENATYPDGTPVAMIAMIQEYGATIDRDAGTVTIYRKINAAGTEFLRNGRFVKRSQSNFSSTHAHGPYTITIPPRPFFRTMITQNQRSWAPTLARILKTNKRIDAESALSMLGEIMVGQLKASIIAMKSPPNAPSTIRKKGFDDPLIETGHMLNSVDYEVTTSQGT